MSATGPERWARIEAVLDAALDRPAAERAALIDTLCGSDAGLRSEVDRLLRSIDAAGDAFEHPPAAVVAAAARQPVRDQLEPGDIVGAYRVIELLGRGGMGAVYLAERADGAFDRQVALKVVKRGMDTDEILERFRRERQILARLEHPNIATLLDGGATDGGVPFFAMELARGQAIDEWCDAHRLTVEQRLRLFLPVCDAVQHAHRTLIVHRDLKPGNILIVEGEPKLLDFGIAKVLHVEEDEEVPATRLQDRRLTPQYAAPEQLRNEPTTTATDVYSLGVILYELLTGRPPYSIHGGMAEIERIVCTTEPRAPSSAAGRERAGRGRDGEDTVRIAELRATRPETLRTALHGDLDAIVMKALEKEPERRYPSVEAFAADLRRHLGGRPVQARTASQLYRIRKFIGRNRAMVFLSIAAAIALVLVAAVALRQAAIARAQSRIAQEEAARATAARDYLIDLFGDLNPDALAGQRTFTLDDLIALSVANLRTLDTQPILRAGIMNAVAAVVFNLGDYDKADSLFTEAASTLVGGSPSADLAVSMMGLGELERRRFRFDSAVASFERALDIRRATLPAHDPRIAESMRALAFAYYNTNDAGRAEDLYEQVLTFENASPEVRAAALEGLGDLQIARARLAMDRQDTTATREAYAAAAAHYGEAVQAWRVVRDGGGPDVARAMWGFAEAESALGDHAGAIRQNREALATMLTTYGEDHPDLFLARYNLAFVLRAADSTAAAAEQFGLAAELGTRFHGDGFIYSGDARSHQGALLLDVGRTREAIDALHGALGIYERWLDTHPDDHTTRESVAGVRQNLGRTAVADARWAEAERQFEAARSDWLQLGDTAKARAINTELAAVLDRSGRGDAASLIRARRY